MEFFIANIVNNSLGPLHRRDTMEGAVDLAIEMVMEQQEDVSEKEVREELEANQEFHDPGFAEEWSVCIGILED